MTFAVVTGGGTAGHVLPALAVADALVARGHPPESIYYVGCERGIETRLLPETDYPYTFLDVDGFQRSISARNLAFGPKMARATRQAIALLRRLAPQVVVTVGGYASMPAVFAARRLKIPIVVVSFDMRPGLASSLTARFARASAVAFPGSKLPRATLTGAPIRQVILNVDRVAQRVAARRQLGIDPDRFMIAVMGGSLGSGLLNDAIWTYVNKRAADATLAVRHVVGERFIDRAPPAVDGEQPDALQYQPVAYESDMAALYTAADLLIGRGGASTTHEVAVTGIPAILVPWSGASEDHQTLNVRWLAERDAAVYLAEDQLGDLGEIIDRLRADPRELEQLAAHARDAGAIHRRGALVDVIEATASPAGEASG